MKLLVCGDPHGSFDHIIQAVLEQVREGMAPDAVILLGDLDCARPLEEELQPILGVTKIRWIPGNHDTDDSTAYRCSFGSKLAKENLHGRVEIIGGVRIAGLGGVFRSKIWGPPTPANFNSYDVWREEQVRRRPPREWGLREFTEERRHKTTIFPDVFNRLAAQSADLLITHEAPDCHPYGWGALSRLGRQMQVKWHFHGHLHDRQDYSDSFIRLGYQAFGVGFRGLTILEKDKVSVIRPGDYDDQYRDWGRNED